VSVVPEFIEGCSQGFLEADRCGIVADDSIEEVQKGVLSPALSFVEGVFVFPKYLTV